MTVILNAKNYIERANKILRKSPEHKKIINDTIETSLRHVLPKNIYDNLKATKVKTSHFYMTPKVHKPGSTYSMHKDIPGRPIVNFIDCHTSKISKFVDHYLQPYAKALPSYFQDTTDFKNKLEVVKDKSKGPIFV